MIIFDYLIYIPSIVLLSSYKTDDTDQLVFWDANVGYSWAINKQDSTILEYQYNYENKRILVNYHWGTNTPRKYFIRHDTLFLNVLPKYEVKYHLFSISEESIGVIDINRRWGMSADTIWYHKSDDQITCPIRGDLLNPDSLR